jgi:carbon starvation protein
MLAAVALMLGVVVLFKMKKERFAWVAIVPAGWLVLCTVTAGMMKLFATDPKVGFLSHAEKFGAALALGEVLAPAKSLADMEKIVFNDRVDAALCVLFLSVVLSMIFFTVRTCRAALRDARVTTAETVAVPA